MCVFEPVVYQRAEKVVASMITDEAQRVRMQRLKYNSVKILYKMLFKGGGSDSAER